MNSKSKTISIILLLLLQTFVTRSAIAPDTTEQKLITA